MALTEPLRRTRHYLGHSLKLISAPEQTQLGGPCFVDVEDRLQVDVDGVCVQDRAVDVEREDVLCAAAGHFCCWL